MLIVSANDELSIEVMNAQTNAVLRVAAYVANPDGSNPFAVVKDITLTTDRVRTEYHLKLPSGLLTAVVAQSNQNVLLRGGTYVNLSIRTRNGQYLNLACGYVSRCCPVYWLEGCGTNEDSLGGSGRNYTYNTASPAAGANLTITVADNQLLLLKSLRFRLTTDANVANRTIQIIINDALTNLVYNSPPTPTHAASLAKDYFYLRGYTLCIDSAFDAYNVCRGWLPDIKLSEGYQIRTDVVNKQVGDQISVVYTTVEEWLQDV